MKKLLIVLFISLTYTATAQDFLAAENDTTVMTEYNDGLLWAYRQIGDFVVGMTNNVEKDDYGKNYQIQIFIKNLGVDPFTFDPSLVTSSLKNKHGEIEEMKVYTHESYMKRVKKQQKWAMALSGIASGISAGSASYQTTYTTTYRVGSIPYTQVQTTYNPAAASIANMAASTEMLTLSRMMDDDQKTISQGYLKMTTIHPDEGIIGYMNVKYQKGECMTINIPIEGQVFSFDWDVAMKQKK